MRTAAVLLSLALTSNAFAAPEGFVVETYSDKVQNPTAFCFDDSGRLYVTETFRFRVGVEDNRDHTYWIMDDLATDTTEQRVAYYGRYAEEKIGDADYFTKESERVVVLEDRDGDGRAEAPTVFADDFDAVEDGPAIGILADPDGRRVLMASVPHLWSLEDADGDGVAERREKLISGLGIKTSLSGHDLHGLIWGPDGKLYFSLGDRGYNVTTKEGAVLKNTNSGAAFRCDPDGSNLEIFYHNLRNPQEIAFNEYGDLFTVDNNCDQGDSARVCYLIEGGDGGWSLGAQALTTYRDHIRDGGMGQRPHWLEEGVWKTRHEGSPQFHLPPIAHLTNGPSGLVFDSGTSMPGRYRNHFLVCDYKGAPNVCFLYSFKVRRSGAGYTMDDAHVFHSGVPNTDVEIGHDGKVYLLDFGGGWTRTDRGNVYAIYQPDGVKNEAVTEAAKLFREGFPADAGALFELLAHPDMRVRQRAQFELVGKPSAELVDQLAEFAASAPEPGCYHAVWALQMLGKNRPEAGERLAELLFEGGAEIRAQAARALGEIRPADAWDLLADAAAAPPLGDESPRVRCLAAIALGKYGDPMAVGTLLHSLAHNDNADLYLRHAAVYALSLLLGDEEIDALPTHRDLDGTRYIDLPAVRLGVCLALRRQLNPRVAEFLADADPEVAAAAVRACNDLDVPGGAEALAEFSRRYAEGGHGAAALSEVLFRRLINANVRAGTPAHAANLVALAGNGTLPETQRLLCLKALETFAAPEPIDPTLGIHRPLEPRDEAAVRAALEAPLLSLFAKSTGDLAAAATKLVTIYDLSLDSDLLARRVLDSRQPERLREAAIERLGADRDFTDKPVFRGALSDPSPAVRAAAGRVWVTRYPGEAMEAIDTLLANDLDSDKRAAFALLAGDSSPEAASRLVENLQRLMDGTLYRTVHLDLYEAAQKQGSDHVRAKLDEVDAWLAGQSRTVYDFTREGGDPDHGRQIFANQGLCLKCHKGERGGGDAGPPLTSIARLRRSDEILASLLNPNAEIIPGYGTMAITLKDGTVHTGSPLDETADTLTLKSATGEQLQIPLTEIQERTPEVSSMPPMVTTGILSKQETRDLMAFLMTLTERR